MKPQEFCCIVLPACFLVGGALALIWKIKHVEDFTEVLRMWAAGGNYYGDPLRDTFAENWNDDTEAKD